MPVENETPERIKLRINLQQSQRIYAGLLSQQKSTQGVFSSQQLAGGLAPSAFHIDKAKQAMDVAVANLKHYDATHPIRNQRE